MLFEGSLLKPSMVTPGAESKNRATPEQVAEYTLKVLHRRIPPAVPEIMSSMILHEVPTMTEDGRSANAATDFRPATSRRRGRSPVYASIQDRRDANNARRRELRQNQRAVATATTPNSTSISVTSTMDHFVKIYFGR